MTRSSAALAAAVLLQTGAILMACGSFGEGTPGAADGSVAAPPAAACASCDRVVFLTKGTVTGSFGGRAKADELCNLEASTSTLAQMRSKSFMAWLSDANTSATDVHVQATGSYAIPSGGIVANGWSKLTSGSLLHAIDEDVNGKQVASLRVWTGTQPGGLRSTFDCEGWTTANASVKATSGLNLDATKAWTDSIADTCDRAWPVYCFER